LRLVQDEPDRFELVRSQRSEQLALYLFERPRSRHTGGARGYILRPGGLQSAEGVVSCHAFIHSGFDPFQPGNIILRIEKMAVAHLCRLGNAVTFLPCAEDSRAYIGESRDGVDAIHYEISLLFDINI
jgi:hypothetical protein